ncbi:MAG: hypothetical protein Q4D16_25475, partial [Eubacteriales bacterium]|nr:hypothetical protein [Eubacteriales bacterium]
VSGLKSDVSGLNNDVSGLKNNVSQLITDVRKLDHKVEDNYNKLEEFYVYQKESNTKVNDFIEHQKWTNVFMHSCIITNTLAIIDLKIRGC